MMKNDDAIRNAYEYDLLHSCFNTVGDAHNSFMTHMVKVLNLWLQDCNHKGFLCMMSKMQVTTINIYQRITDKLDVENVISMC